MAVRMMVAMAAGLIAASCTTEARFNETMGDLVGKPESAAIALLGIPNQTYSSDGSKLIGYTATQQGYVAGIAPSYQSTVIGNTVYTQAVGGMSGYSYTDTCTVVFEISDGLIRNYQYRGNACRW